MNRHNRRLTGDLRIGIRVGLSFSVAFSVLAAIAFVILLMNGEASAIKRDTGLNFPEIILLYVVGGLVGGVLIGLLRPLRSTAVGSFVIGTISAFPCFMGYILMTDPRTDWYPFGVLAALGGSMALCGSLGFWFYFKTNGWTD
jgi:peptidoglycan/LPS O-acetylase OafA/YrhL